MVHIASINAKEVGYSSACVHAVLNKRLSVLCKRLMFVNGLTL